MIRAWLSALGLGTALRRAFGIRLGRLFQYPPRALSVPSIAAPGLDQNLPSIAVVTPSFNQAAYVGATMESVLSQRYPHLEYIVQDAGSTDGSLDVLAGFADRGVTVVVEPDRGQSDALNRGFARTSAEVLAYLNSDDMYVPGTLHRIGRFFRDNPSVDVVYGNRLVIDDHSREIGRWILPRHDAQVLQQIDYVPQETMFWRRRIWERCGARFDENATFALDWDLLLRFLQQQAVFRHLPWLFALFRAHAAQKTQASFVADGAGEMRLLRLQNRAQSGNYCQRLASHGFFLLAHQQADKQFARELRDKLTR
ncbi:glycosyltransferase family 2 protein [Tardiphaga sp. 604_B6_N1_1]|uniref:glycosyltransferase family 2 protein n=1 Tax=Tardiphaga sp. 604_B6_N1_1 TaxID=3240779 RepID=UPI003F293F2A